MLIDITSIQANKGKTRMLYPAIRALLFGTAYSIRGHLKEQTNIVQALRKAAQRLKERGEQRAATALYVIAVRLFPQSEELVCEYAQTEIEWKAFHSAEKIIEAWRQRHPGSLLASATYTRFLHATGQMKKAQELLDALLEDQRKHMTSDEALWLARTSTLLKKYSAAKDLLTSALQRDSTNVALVKELGALLRNTGNYSEARAILGSTVSQVVNCQQIAALRNIVDGELAVYQEKARPTLDSTLTANGESSDTIFMLLEAALPFRKSGYTYRSHALLKGMAKLELQCEAFSAPGSSGPLPPGNELITSDLYEGVRYHRGFLPQSANYRHYPLNEFLQYSAEQAVGALGGKKPRFFHAASNFKNGLVAAALSKTYDVPWVYELRGLWHETQCALGVITEESDRYKYFTQMEKECLSNADVVVTLSEQLKRYVVNSTGRRQDTVFVLPNGVNTSEFTANESLRAKKRQQLFSEGVSSLFIMGYIGSLNAYEGLDDAILAFAQIEKDIPNARLLIVGDGEDLQRLQDLTATLLQDPSKIIFTGRVPQSEVPSLMSSLDLFLLPRKAARVCEMVPPIKPLEAMAMGVPVICSDLPVLTELIQNEVNGFTFEAGKIQNLSQRIRDLADSKRVLGKVGNSARESIQSFRDWEIIASGYEQVYDKAAEEFAKRRAIVSENSAF